MSNSLPQPTGRKAADEVSLLAAAAEGNLDAAAELAPEWSMYKASDYRLIHYGLSVALETHDWDVISLATDKVWSGEERERRG